MLPTFIIIGAQKSGTSSLNEVLSAHPQVTMSAVKETNFFTSERQMRRGIEFYESYFEVDRPGTIACGEASPSYAVAPDAPKRIKEALGDVKLIYCLRDPVSRAYSQYWMDRNYLAEWRGFDQLVRGFLADDEGWRSHPRGYFERGLYIQHIERYLEHFSQDDLHVLFLDDLATSPMETYRRIFEHVGVDPTFECPAMEMAAYPAARWVNPLYTFFFNRIKYAKFLSPRMRKFLYFGKTIPFRKPPMMAGTKELLSDYYRPFNERLSAYLGENVTHWSMRKSVAA